MRKQNQPHALYPLLGAWPRLVNHTVGQGSSRFHPLYVIHGHESLERCIGALPPGADRVARRSVEGIHIRQRCHALYVCVHTAAVECIAVLLRVMYGVTGWVAYLLPNAGRLVGL